MYSQDLKKVQIYHFQIVAHIEAHITNKVLGLIKENIRIFQIKFLSCIFHMTGCMGKLAFCDMAVFYK